MVGCGRKIWFGTGGIRYDFVGGILRLRAITLITPAKQWVRGRIRYTEVGNLGHEYDGAARLLLRGRARARVCMYVMTRAFRTYDCGQGGQ